MTLDPCPFVAPDGNGPCTLPDLPQLHEQARGLSLHLCSTEPEPANPQRRDDWRARRLFSYATSKRDAGRWARLPLVTKDCRRSHPEHGVGCTLPDTRDAHEHAGHWSTTVHGHWSWPIDVEDQRRWEPPVILHLLDGIPENVGDGVPYPTDWTPQPGDYPFVYMATNYLDAAARMPAMRARAEGNLRAWGRRVSRWTYGVLAPIGDGRQYAIWYRTEPDPDGKIQHRYHRGRAWTSPPGTSPDNLDLWTEITGP